MNNEYKSADWIMKILISGDGDTGSHLARQLSMEDQDVILMGRDKAHLDDLDSRYNIMTYEGIGVSPDSLREAGVADCDLFIAVTPWENENMISSQLAKSMGAGRTVARIDNGEFMRPEVREIFRRTGIDELVYPEYVAADVIATTLTRNWVRSWFELHGGALIVAGVKLMPGCELDGMPLHDLGKSRNHFHVSAIRRGSETIIPRGSDVLHAGDVAYFSMLRGGGEEVAELCGRSSHKVSKIMISGAGRISRQLARRFSGRFDITVVDSDRAKCAKLAAMAPGVTVVNSDQRDVDVLREEGIDSCDVYLALNDSSEMNIVGCMLAKDAGVEKTIAEIEDIQYFVEADSLNIDVVINKKLLTSSTIFQMLLDTDLPTPRCLALEDAEVAEIVAGENSPVTRAPVSDLRLPRDMTLAGMIRDGEGMLVSGSTHIRAGDHVVVFCLSGSLNKFEKLFK